jgi:hypothetical protein
MSKERIHFAERVKVKLVPRESVANATKERNELHVKINMYKVDIDRNVFKKTDSERHELKVAKQLWKQRVA